MTISDKVTLQPPSVVKSVQPAQKAAQVQKASAQKPARGDRVRISDQAREMQAARQTVAQMSDVDEEKVARIKAQIRNGTYKVDGRKAAGKMLAESLLVDR